MLEHLAGPGFRPSRVVVVGRSGFLARHLTDALKHVPGQHEAVGRPELDLSSSQSVDALTEVVRPEDTVVVLAALTPDKGRDFKTLMKNLRMAEHLCEFFERRPCAHVVYVSSDAVYDGRQIPIDEQSSREPVDLYALMHTAREMMLQSVITSKNIPFCAVRPVALFGPGDTHNSYGPNRFAREAVERRTITMFGRGDDERSHLFVEDAVRLIVACVMRRTAGVLNLCGEEAVTFRQVAEIIAAACPFHVELVFKERPGAGGASQRPFADGGIRRAFPDFQWTPLPAAIELLVSALIPAKA